MPGLVIGRPGRRAPRTAADKQRSASCLSAFSMAADLCSRRRDDRSAARQSTALGCVLCQRSWVMRLTSTCCCTGAAGQGAWRGPAAMGGRPLRAARCGRQGEQRSLKPQTHLVEAGNLLQQAQCVRYCWTGRQGEAPGLLGQLPRTLCLPTSPVNRCPHPCQVQRYQHKALQLWQDYDRLLLWSSLTTACAQPAHIWVRTPHADDCFQQLRGWTSAQRR
jgi:hypothetical protein